MQFSPNRTQTFCQNEAGVIQCHVAGSLPMSEGAIKVAVHRLRQHYAELIRAEIAQTVATPAAVDDELHYLFAGLRA